MLALNGWQSDSGARGMIGRADCARARRMSAAARATLLATDSRARRQGAFARSVSVELRAREHADDVGGARRRAAVDA